MMSYMAHRLRWVPTNSYELPTDQMVDGVDLSLGVPLLVRLD